MWGQKQSAMITEVMLFQILLATNNEGKVTKSNISESMFILSDGVFEHYMPEEAIKEFRNNGKKYFNKEYTKKLFNDIDKHIKSFFKFSEDIKKIDFTNLSNQKLKKILTDYFSYIKKTFIYFGTSTPESTYFLEKKVKEIIRKKVHNDEIFKDYFISLCTPEEMDVTMEERIYFFNLMKKKKVSEKEIEVYSRKFPALFFNTYSKKEVIDYLYEKLKEKKTEKEINLEIKNIKDNLIKVSKKHEEIYSIINDKKLKEYSTILQKSGIFRYRLKHCWSGAEYLCLDLLKEVQKRIGGEFNDFIKTYTFKDIFYFLETGKSLNINKIKERKKSIILHHVNNNTNTYFGANGVKHKNEFIEKEDKKIKSKTIKGMPANRGIITAKARIVNVKDLKQFSKDCKQFQKGEIIVTTMTSPIMVQIIQKSSGIITDEGGICSHAAVISREFGIPCIVGTLGASFIIKTGDLIELDANKGTIEIIKKKKDK
jgi:rifampicin phosphotransferase